MFGSHGSGDYVDLKHFDTLGLCREYLKNECQCTIFGIEIIDGALPVQGQPFSGNTAFMLGNEVWPSGVEWSGVNFLELKTKLI